MFHLLWSVAVVGLLGVAVVRTVEKKRRAVSAMKNDDLDKNGDVIEWDI